MFKMKYAIEKDYLPKGTNRRGGRLISKVKFIVLHDVGNDGYNKATGRKNGTTARNNISYYRSTPTISASAHTFIDDKEILECIPAVTGAPEKAWHVIYNKPKDNQLFGADSNDAAIGVELCYYPEDKARSQKAYDKYVWYCAYLAYKFGLDPAKCFVGHETLDPGRKTDPSNGLKYIGKTTAQCIQDIIAEYKACTGQSTATSSIKEHIGIATVLVKDLNVRKGDNVSAPVLKVVHKNEAYKVYEIGKWGYRVSTDGWISKGSSYTSYKKR